METGPVVCDIMVLIAELATTLGACPLNVHPRVWMYRLDEHWILAANGHRETMRDVGPCGCMPVDVPPFHVAVWWHGWLAGILAPNGGPFAAHPDGANEDRFIADLKAAIQKAKGE